MPDTEGRDENSSLSPRDDGSDEHSTGAAREAAETIIAASKPSGPDNAAPWPGLTKYIRLAETCARAVLTNEQAADVAAEEQDKPSSVCTSAPALQAEVERLREVNADLLEALTHMARVIDDGGQPHPMGPAMLKVRAALTRSTEV